MNNIVRLYPFESHLPEYATQTFPALKIPVSRNNWKGPNYHPQRPVRLLQQPLPIDVIALIPDGPPITFIWHKQQHKISHAEGKND